MSCSGVATDQSIRCKLALDRQSITRQDCTHDSTGSRLDASRRSGRHVRRGLDRGVERPRRGPHPRPLPRRRRLHVALRDHARVRRRRRRARARRPAPVLRRGRCRTTPTSASSPSPSCPGWTRSPCTTARSAGARPSRSWSSTRSGAYAGSTCTTRPRPIRQGPEQRGHSGDHRDRRVPGTHARAVARPLPRRGGLRRARRGAGLLGALRRRRPDAAAGPAVVDLPLARLEGPDPVPGPALPRGGVRPARQRPVRPAAAPAAVRRGRVRRRRARRARRDRDRAGGRRLAVARRPAGAAAGRRPPRARAGGGVRGPVVPGQPGARAALAGHGAPVGGRAAVHPPPAGGRLVALQRCALARGLRRLRRLVGVPPHVHHAALDQADRGRDRLGASRPTPSR